MIRHPHARKPDVPSRHTQSEMLDIQSKESRDIGLARTQLEVLDRDLAYLERDFRAKETAYFAAKERSVGHPTTTIGPAPRHQPHHKPTTRTKRPHRLVIATAATTAATDHRPRYEKRADAKRLMVEQVCVVMRTQKHKTQKNTKTQAIALPNHQKHKKTPMSEAFTTPSPPPLACRTRARHHLDLQLTMLMLNAEKRKEERVTALLARVQRPDGGAASADAGAGDV